jgi:hypothetical protein
MQSIMWIVLAGTVGLAAVVDRAKARSMFSALDDPVTFTNFSIQLPAGWEQVEEASPGSLVHVRDDEHMRQLTVSVHRPNLFELLMPGETPGRPIRRTTEQVKVGDGDGILTIYPVVNGRYEVLKVARAIPGVGTIAIEMQSPAGDKRRAHPANIDLIKRVAASVTTAKTQ